MKLMICGGGTAGHVFPGIALAEALLELDPDAEVLFIGTENGIEKNIIPSKGYRLITLPSKPLNRKDPLQAIAFGFSIFTSFFKALALIRKEKPDVVIGMGGFASFAPLVAGAMYGTPRLLHEQNSIPGLANRTLAKFCPTLAVSYADSKRYFNKKVGIFLTGNPIRKELLNHTDRAAARQNLGLEEKFTVLIFGGSRGATKLNKAAVELAQLMNGLDVQIVLITGKNDYEEVSRHLQGNTQFKIFAFHDDMGKLYSASDLVVSRAGATTLAEITALGKPSILIPYPYATDDHQYENAKMLEKNEAALLIRDQDITGQAIFNKIKQLVDNVDQLQHLANSVLDYGRPDAARALAKVVLAEQRMKP